MFRKSSENKALEVEASAMAEKLPVDRANAVRSFFAESDTDLALDCLLNNLYDYDIEVSPLELDTLRGLARLLPARCASRHFEGIGLLRIPPPRPVLG